MLTKTQVKERLGFTTDRELAALFGISPSAVCLWPPDGPIPELRELQLPRLRPDVFKQAA